MRCIKRTSSPIARRGPCGGSPSSMQSRLLSAGQTAAARQSVRQFQIAAAGRGDEGLAQDAAHPHPAPAAVWPNAIPLFLDPLERTFAASSMMGRIELDTNTVERVIRPVAPRFARTTCFAGSDGGGARMGNRLLPHHYLPRQAQRGRALFAYLKDVLERMSSGHPMSRLDDLLALELGALQTLKNLTDV